MSGYLEVGLNDNHEIVVNHPDIEPDENGVGHIVFSAEQARHFARLLVKHARLAEKKKPKPRFNEGCIVRLSSFALSSGVIKRPRYGTLPEERRGLVLRDSGKLRTLLQWKINGRGWLGPAYIRNEFLELTDDKLEGMIR